LFIHPYILTDFQIYIQKKNLHGLSPQAYYNDTCVMDPFGPRPDPLLFRKSGSTGNRTQTSGSVARGSIYFNLIFSEIKSWYIHILINSIYLLFVEFCMQRLHHLRSHV
jgi:hypothetical protein